MALLHSEMKPLGALAPHFEMKSVEGVSYTLESFKDKKILVILFLCNHCPYVKAIEDRIIQLHRNYLNRDVQIVGICSNDPTDYPEDTPANLKRRWLEKNYQFPYLIDDTQNAAKAFGAVCTPDIFVFDHNRKLAYHGRLDNNWKDPNHVTRQDLRIAIDLLLAGEHPSENQTPSMGCSIKWKKQNTE